MYLGVDVGGSVCRVAAFANCYEPAVVDRVEFAVSRRPNGDFEQDFGKLVDACQKLASLHEAVEGIGLSVAGNWNPACTMLLSAGNLSHWVHYPVVAMLSEAMDCLVVGGGDAFAAALAEAWYGHGQQEDFWFVVWGTGVGGCLVRRIDGQIHLFPGELGHQQVYLGSGLLCGCGQYGCLEAYCGGAGIKKRFEIPAAELSLPQWGEVLAWMRSGVRNIITAQPVPLVVFGGGIASRQPHCIDQIKQGLATELRIVEPPDLCVSALGEDVGVVGALSLVRRRMNDGHFRD